MLLCPFFFHPQTPHPIIPSRPMQCAYIVAKLQRHRAQLYRSAGFRESPTDRVIVSRSILHCGRRSAAQAAEIKCGRSGSGDPERQSGRTYLAPKAPTRNDLPVERGLRSGSTSTRTHG